MAIIDTITDPSKFWDWLQSSDSYKTNFSYEGAVALQDHIEDLSEQTGKDIEFDPVAWCVGFTEYESLDEVKANYDSIKTLEDLQGHTTVIELENGRLVIEDF